VAHVTALGEWVEGFDYPMYVVTCAADGRRDGCLVGFATQCSIDPPRLLVCLSDQNHTYRTARSATHLAVHTLAKEQHELAELFGSRTGDDVDKFALCDWDEIGGVPVLRDAPRYVVGSILETAPWGDHLAFLLDAPAPVVRRTGPVLMFSDVQNLEPGHDA
jgi:flavin reductase (DIM6/NTAB) family NADH-FMN oxidoreductase RutF